MEYRTGHFTITSDDVTRWVTLALRTIRRRFRPHAEPLDPAQRLAAAAQHELSAAQQLLTWKQHRAAGAVAGVALELHLKYLAHIHSLEVRPYATIAQVQDTLRYAGVLTRSQGRLIGKFAAIRNQCVHAQPEPLRRAAVEKLITGVAQMMQARSMEQNHA